MLGNCHDAEDAFQATFLVLARRAAKLDRRGPLAGWLHTVAYRLALRSLAQAHQKRRRERQAARQVAEESGIEEWRPILDEELQRLPEKYRLPLVLCYLQGKTNAEAALALGWPAGSMSRRLSRARELLRERLVGRGVGLPAALLGVAAASDLEAAAPASLLTATVRAAVAFGGGQVAVEVSTGARVLAQAYLKGMAMTKIKVIAAVVILAGLVVGGTLAQQAPGKKQGGSDPMSESRLATDRAPGPEAKDQKEPVPVRLRPGDIPIGLLGHPLGDYLTIEGTRERGFKTGRSDLARGHHQREKAAQTH